jgi:pimeloyl-ACP methyl ester carboxylesterase
MIRRLLATVFCLSLFAGLIAGCAANSQNADESIPPIELSPCRTGGITAQCGTYSVYENRAARTGRTIDLRIAVLPATGEPRAPDPFFWFEGGPGGSAVDSLPSIAPGFAELNKHRDLVFVDQRGTGGSNRLVCPEPEGALDIDDAVALKAYAESCVESLDTDPAWYTSRAFADDIDDVRQALGYEQINIVGVSYGATSVQVYLLHHAEHVRTMTMLSGTLLDYPIFERVAWSSQRALDRLFARCAADEACRSAFPNLETEFETVLAQLEAAPVDTHVIIPQTRDRLTVTRDVFVNVVHAMLVGEDVAVQLPRLVHRAYQSGDWDSLANIYVNRILAVNSEGMRLIMGAVIRCYEPWAVYSPDEVARAGGESYLMDAQVVGAQSTAQVCPVVPRPEPGALYGPTQSSTVPVLLISGDEDPIDPPENVAGVEAVYPNSRVLIEPYSGHYTVNWPCRTSVVTEFIELGTLDGLQADCVSRIKPLPFDTRP